MYTFGYYSLLLDARLVQKVWNQFGKIVCVVVSQSKDEEDYHPFVLMAGRDHFAMYLTAVPGHVSISAQFQFFCSCQLLLFDSLL